MLRWLTSIVSELAELQSGLSATTLILEFGAILGLTFVCASYKCLERSALFWKRTDYFYFFMTICGSALALADYTGSGWNRQLQDMRLAQTAILERLRNIAVVIASKCKEEDMRRLELRRSGADARSGILRPPFEEGYRFDYKFHYETRDAIDCDAVTRMIEAIDRRGSRMAEDLTAINEASTHPVPIDGLLSIDDGTNGSLLRSLIDENASRAVQISNLTDDMASLSYTNFVRQFFPILVGLGLGVRLARTHYDVKKEKRDAVPRSEPG